MKNKNNWFDLSKRVYNLETSPSGIEVFDPNKEYNEGDIVLKVGEGIFRKRGSEAGIKVLSEQFFGSAEEQIDFVYTDMFPWKVYTFRETGDAVFDYDSFKDFAENNIEFLIYEAGGQTTIEGLLFLYKGAVYTLTIEILTGNGWETLLSDDKLSIKRYPMNLDLYYHKDSEVIAIKDYIYDNLIDTLKVGDMVTDNQTKYNIFLTVVSANNTELRLVGYFFRDTSGTSGDADSMLRTDIELNLHKGDRNGTQTYCRVYEADTVYRAYSINIKDNN